MPQQLNRSDESMDADVRAMLEMLEPGAQLPPRLEQPRNPDKILEEDWNAAYADFPGAKCGIGDETPIDRPLRQIFSIIVTEAIHGNADSIYMEPGEQRGLVRYTVGGELRNRINLARPQIFALIRRTKQICGMDAAERQHSQEADFPLVTDGKNYLLHVTTETTRWGEKLTIGIAPDTRG